MGGLSNSNEGHDPCLTKTPAEISGSTTRFDPFILYKCDVVIFLE